VIENKSGEEKKYILKKETPNKTAKRCARNLLAILGSPGSARIGRYVSVRWASSAHLVSPEEFSNDSLWAHCKCFL